MSADPFAFDQTPRFAVMGQPIRHSLSPWIHARFGEQLGIRLSYEAIEVAPGGLAQAVSHFQALGGHGLNITVPLKLEAAHLADRLEPSAERAGAANTLILGDEMVGANTDGAGLIVDLEAAGIALAGIQILIIGAGGAVRGVLDALIDARVAALVIANRDPGHARALVAPRLARSPCELFACDLESIPVRDFGLILQATSAGLRGDLPALAGVPALPPGTPAYDLLYGPASQPFRLWALSMGLHPHDGLGMLVAQAAESFRLWHGRRPDPVPVLAQLRAHLESKAKA